MVNLDAFLLIYSVLLLITLPSSALFYCPMSAQWGWGALSSTCTTAWTYRKFYQGRQMLTYSEKTSYCNFLLRQTIILPWYQFEQHQNCNKKYIFHKKDNSKSTIIFYKYRCLLFSHPAWNSVTWAEKQSLSKISVTLTSHLTASFIYKFLSAYLFSLQTHSWKVLLLLLPKNHWPVWYDLLAKTFPSVIAFCFPKFHH